MKRVEVDGKFFRMRRGKLVEIPAQWTNKIPHAQTMRKRQSKIVGKKKRTMKWRPAHPVSIEYIDRHLNY